ncbi:Uncharacterized protein M6B38_239365 [Iris pallida]|uniref:RING-type E3 ubiquitin transferase n=1 Tax=Iris pallida TaxID=29817 RepID=A0AAX6DKV5_IRIPA|nr:Uncharacterized protein M6B38_239365 [Iris pallida]
MAPSPNPRVRIRVSPTLLFLFFSTLLSTSATKISYSDHCSSFVPSSPDTDNDLTYTSVTRIFPLSGGEYSGGDQILGADPNSTLSVPRSFSFHPRSVRETLDPGTLSLTGTLIFYGGGIGVSGAPGRSLRFAQIRPRRPRTFNRFGRASFELSGFWSEPASRLCMVGEGFGRSREGISLDLSAVFKLNYPNVSYIWNAVVSGTIESLDDRTSVNYFDPVKLLVYTEKNYAFTKVPDAIRSCSVVKTRDEPLGFDDTSFGDYVGLHMSQTYRLEYKADCSGGSCGPFDRRFGFSPSFMSLYRIRWYEDGRVQMSMAFSMQRRFRSNRIFETGKTLVGEGGWDGENNRLCVTACRVADADGSSTVSDCTIGLSLWFPSVLSIEQRSTISGQIWSYREKNDSGYFDMVSFANLDTILQFRSYYGLKYKYTELDLVNGSCVQGDASSVRRRRFPNVKNAGDMSLSIVVKDAGGNSSWGYAGLLFVGEKLYGSLLNERFQIPVAPWVADDPRCWNVSYYVRYGNESNNPTEISAEGTYDVETGMLIMVGCRQVGSSLDCGILINIQLAPLNPEEGEYSKGKISSTRENSDPLFFKPLEISARGMYRTQAAENIRWMNIEITMVLLSLTLSCIFIGLQLYHIKKHPEVLPSISITMLVILTLGHMIPLVLNFEALFFKNHSRQISLVQSGGWLEVNEVVVRVITMVAFLLQSRLLQVAWSARSADERKQGLWSAERKSLVLCLPIYIVGGLITLFVHFGSFGTEQERLDYSSSDYHSIWEDLFSYAGLILDGFLFPQFLLNIFCNSKDKSLAPAFYGGTTVVRSLPHVYDAYRAHHYIPHVRYSYIYASQNGDLYSSAWDIIIPCAGMLFGVLIFLQQRFGGALILPKRIRESGGYEMVPVVGQ